MTERRRSYDEGGEVEARLLRESLQISRYRKTRTRDPEKRRLLLELALARIWEAERDDYQPTGFRRRRLKVFPSSKR